MFRFEKLVPRFSRSPTGRQTSGCSLICVLIELLEIGPEKKKGIKGGGGGRG